MNICRICGSEYEEKSCPFCAAKTENSGDDIVSGFFPEYSEEVPRIIGTLEKEQDSFTANKESIYRRNNLIVQEAALVERETNARLAEAEKREIAERSDEIRSRKLFNNFIRAAIGTGIAAAALIAVIAGASVIMRKTNQSAGTQELQTEIYQEQGGETAVRRKNMTEDKKDNVTVENHEEAAETEVITAAAYLTPEQTPLEASEGQLSYSDGKVSIIAELESIVPMSSCPADLANPDHREGDHIVTVAYTLKNIGDESFDFIPQKLELCTENGTGLEVITYRHTNAVCSDSSFTAECGTEYSFKVSYVISSVVCGELSDVLGYTRIKYDITDDTFKANNYEGYIDASKLNNAGAAAGIDLVPESGSIFTGEILDYLEEQYSGAAQNNVRLPLTPQNGEYSATTENASYCFSVQKTGDLTAVVRLRVQNLTNDAAFFLPFDFRIGVNKMGESKDLLVYKMSFDPALASSPKVSDVKIDGYDVIYDRPSKLSMGADGYAEYILFFADGGVEGDYFTIESVKYDSSEDSFNVKI